MKNVLAEACTVKIENFEGPLDLLFHLVEKNKMDICDVQISEIADQYIEYLFAMQHLDLEIAGEFLVMAATLLHIKSRLLLPQNISDNNKMEIVAEEDPREQLIAKLTQYKLTKQLAEMLRKRENEYSRMLYRDTILLDKKLPPCDLKIQKIIDAYNSVLDRCRNRFQDVSSRMAHVMQREIFSVRAKMRSILELLLSKVSLKFSDLFGNRKKVRAEVVAAFLAILELTKAKKIGISQNGEFGDVLITRANGESYEHN